MTEPSQTKPSQTKPPQSKSKISKLSKSTPREPSPPAILYTILKIFIRRDMKLFVLGDFDEEYLEIAQTKGRGAADRWYWRHCLRSLPRIIKDSAARNTMMLRNYLTITVRSMKRQKVFSLINILGLSLALMVCLWIFLFIKDEVSFDRFHKNRDSIYSVIKADHHFDNQRRRIEPNLGPALKDRFPGIEYSVRITRRDVVTRYKDRLFSEQCDFVDPDFFRMFSFGMIQGEAFTALESESAVVLTESLAGKYFGREHPIGKTMTITIGQVQKDFVVSGVAADAPSNSFIQFKMLMNFNELIKIYGPPEWDNRNAWTLAYTFIQLKQGISPRIIEAGLPDFFEQQLGPLIEDRKSRGSWNEDGPTITFWLQSLKDIHLHSQGIEGPRESQVSKSYILGGIGFLILFIACVNFTNLSIGRASTRTVEIGMRKILGANRKNLIRQFWSESALVVVSAMGLGLIAAILLLPLFNRLAGKNIQESDVLTFSNLVLFAAFALALGILAGIYPGTVLSRIQPATFFRGSLSLGGNTFMTRLLVMVQFSVTVFLIMATFVLSRQLKYILTKDLGYNREGVVVINTFERDYELNHQIFTIFRTEAESLPHIKEISGCVFPLSSEIGSGKITYNDKRLDFNFTSVHFNFFDTMGIKFIAGSDFPLQNRPNPEPIIVTESFVKAFEIENPVGTLLDVGSKIVGVVEDIHFWNLKQEIKPTLILMDRRNGPRHLLVRVDTSDMGRAIGSLEKIWKTAQPNKPFDYSFEDDIFLSKYEEEKRWNGIVLFASFFAILISCMGLIGITALTMSRRIKEIGIRRILGAPVLRICRLLTTEYLILVAASNLIAWPLGYYVMLRWLNGYAYRTHFDAGIFALTGALTMIVSMGTIGFWVFKAASSDPAESLRYE